MDDLREMMRRESLCGARTRTGEPCKRRGMGAGGRCPNHGGMSTGPRTKAGRQRIAAAQRLRWAEHRTATDAGSNSRRCDPSEGRTMTAPGPE